MLVSLLGCADVGGAEQDPSPRASSASTTTNPPPRLGPPLATQELRVFGLSVPVPAYFVPLESHLRLQIQNASRGRDPRAIVTSDALRAPGGLQHGMVFAMREVFPTDDDRMRIPVSDAVSWAAESQKLLMERRGARIELWEASQRDGRFDALMRVRMPKPEDVVVTTVRMVGFVTPEGQLVQLSATCQSVASPSMTANCESMLRSATVDDEPRRRLDEQLGPPRGSRHDATAGLELAPKRADGPGSDAASKEAER